MRYSTKRKIKKCLKYSFCLCFCPTSLLKTLFFKAFPCLQKKHEWETDQLSIDTFASLQLNRTDVIRLQGCFRDIDEDSSGTVDIDEFLAHVDTPITAFSQRVFSIMDEDGNGKVRVRVCGVGSGVWRGVAR